MCNNKSVNATCITSLYSIKGDNNKDIGKYGTLIVFNLCFYVIWQIKTIYDSHNNIWVTIYMTLIVWIGTRYVALHCVKQYFLPQGNVLTWYHIIILDILKGKKLYWLYYRQCSFLCQFDSKPVVEQLTHRITVSALILFKWH